MKANSPAGMIFLRDIEIFQDLTESEVDALGEKMPLKDYAAKTVFYTPEDEGEILFMLKRGRVRLFRLSADGKSFTTATLGAGAFFGKMALLGQSLYGNYAEASSDCTVCLISRADARKYLIGDARIAFRIIETLGKRLLEIEERLAGAILQQVPARVAAVLLQFADAMPQVAPNAPVEILATHEELAQTLGIHRETMTRTLRQFSRLNLVELGRGRIRLLDQKALRDLSAV